MDIYISYKNEDDKAFESLFKKYYIRLCGFANKFVNNISEAEEIVQEVYLNIWKNRDRINFKEDIKPLLFKSVQNACFNFIQHKKVVDGYYKVISEAYKNEAELTETDTVIYSELSLRIDEALGALPEQCGKIFRMSRNEGLKYKEIAQQLNISVKTVETQMSRALSKLKVELKDYLVLLIVSLFIK